MPPPNDRDTPGIENPDPVSPQQPGATQQPAYNAVTYVQIFRGFIRDYFARSDTYLVLDPIKRISVECQALHSYGNTGTSMGARTVSGGYPPRTPVLVARLPDMNVILGMLPISTYDLAALKSDEMVMRAQVSIADPKMQLHAEPLKQEEGLSYYDAGRPLDALSGDWGGMNELGVAMFIGKLLACIRASDSAKVEAFWGDDLLRIVGYNLQIFTGVREEFEVTDEGEGNLVRRSTPFSWEGIGAKEVNAEAVEKKGSSTGVAGRARDPEGNAWWEPKEKDQLVIPRHTLMRGYMGDLEHEWIHVPGKNIPDNESYANNTKYVGVLEIAKNITGAYLVRSAKEISFEKAVLIPVPKEKKAPDDALGDNRKNYHAAGSPSLGEGGDLPKLNEYEYPEKDDASGWFDYLYDVQSWMYNRLVIGGLYMHTDKFGGKDWYLPEESDVTGEFQTPPATASIKPGLLNTGNKFMVPLPEEAKLKVDHREGHGSVRYYQSRSIFKMQEDGSILIEDGYGSAIQMKGGSIFLTCVGDVFMQPGRNIINWAPRDFIARAGNCVDITSAKKDIHIKAEKNLEVIAGNGDDGAIILDCRSVGKPTKAEFTDIGEDRKTRGILVKAADSPIYMFGDDCFIGVTKDNGRLTLDGKETGQLYFRGKEAIFKTPDFNVINPDTTELLRVHNDQLFLGTVLNWVNGAAYFSSPVKMNTYVEIDGFVNCLSSIYAKEHFASKTGGEVGRSPDIPSTLPSDSAIKDTVTEEHKTVKDEVTLAEYEVVDDVNAPGNEEFQTRVHFSCRKTSQYFGNQEGTFFMWETRWQNLLKQGGGTTWDEPEVERPGGGNPEMPHPGREAWKEQSKFKYVETFDNFDPATGIAKNRTSLQYKGKKPKKEKLSDKYIINTQT